jgi:glycosyltransferase involved in cell wall biosynthesis
MECYDADVALAPLEANMFTAFKSNLKILEAGCKNLPIICSNVPPYSDEPPTLGVMYASNTREWVEWFQWCVRNPTAVKELGQQLGQYVREHYDLRKINEHRKQIIESLIN